MYYMFVQGNKYVIKCLFFPYSYGNILVLFRSVLKLPLWYAVYISYPCARFLELGFVLAKTEVFLCHTEVKLLVIFWSVLCYACSSLYKVFAYFCMIACILGNICNIV